MYLFIFLVIYTHQNKPPHKEHKMNALHNAIFDEMHAYDNAQALNNEELNELKTKVFAITGIQLDDLFAAYDNSNITYMNIGKDYEKFTAYLKNADEQNELAYYVEEFVDIYHD